MKADVRKGGRKRSEGSHLEDGDVDALGDAPDRLELAFLEHFPYNSRKNRFFRTNGG